MNIEIRTNDPLLFQELKAAAEEPSSHLPENMLIGNPIKESPRLHAFPSPEVISFAITIGTSLATGVLSAWIFEKFKGRVNKVKIDGKEVKLSIEEINNAIKQYVTQSQLIED